MFDDDRQAIEWLAKEFERATPEWPEYAEGNCSEAPFRVYTRVGQTMFVGDSLVSFDDAAETAERRIREWAAKGGGA
jgi:hypothetical protein